jgi:predicted phage terminase large subunit-like protein
MTYEEALARIEALSPAQLAEFDRYAAGVSTREPAPLLDWIPRISRQYSAPRHLAPFIDLIERAQREPIRAVVHAPPRHAKTETALHGIAWALEKAPHRTHAFVTYADALSRSKSRRAREFARSAGVRLADDAAALNEWRTREGGGLLATGVGGPLTGQGVSGMLLVDDPVKNRQEAESATIRERVWEWFNDVAYTRLEPGASAIVIMTRWHPDDLAGKLIRDRGWMDLRLPAMSDAGEALWPERFSVEALAAIREQVGPYTWASLYQGTPRARGGALFGDVFFYDALPSTYRVALGFDLAYSKKTSADYSVAIVMYESAGQYYVVDVVRKQERAPAFKKTASAVHKRYPHAGRRWYAYGPEIAVADLFRDPPDAVNVGAAKGQGDKFVRAQGVAAAWNSGKVLVPRDAPWLDVFLAEVEHFTGVNDDHDDQVDALAAAFDELFEPSASHETPSASELPRGRLSGRPVDVDDLDDDEALASARRL